MSHLEVAVAAPLEHTLTYCLPKTIDSEFYGIDSHPLIGRRVLVPLGKRKVTGYVLGTASSGEQTSYKIKEIIKFQDEYSLFHENIVPLYRWLAQYYHYPIGLIVKSSLPSGLSPKSVTKIVLREGAEKLKEYFENDMPCWARKLAQHGQLDAHDTTRLLAESKQKKHLTCLAAANIVTFEDVIGRDGIREKNEICYGLASADLKKVQSSVIGSVIGSVVSSVISREGVKEYRNAVKKEFGIELKVTEIKALYSLQNLTEKNNRQTVALKDLHQDYSGASRALKSLAEKKLVFSTKERVIRSPFGDQLKHYPRPDRLTIEQINVLDKIRPAIREKKFSPFLLHGVTGCGKTEVYLRAAEETLALGRDVIIMVPEIALATQLESHLVSRFGDLVVLLHSAMTTAEKYDQFYLALSGKAKIAIGARSALFAPFRDPGLIVVDEEHDSSFKQDDNFRYHGRDIAVLRAKHHDATVILGSATPSITSYSHAKNGKYTLLTMGKRVGDRSLPIVTIVDLNKNQAKEAEGIIKKELHAGLALNLEAGKQSILLLNRRGFSAVVLCRDCGTPVQCSHCHVSLTLHKGRNQLVCHYCGFTVSNNCTCLQCRSTDLVPAGFGTERVEDEILRLFPKARVKRLDSDIAADRKKFLSILTKMHEGDIDILIGTQMIAKGHHFPNVTLVGVVWADGGMNMPDFRAAERTFQLITQVIGRAGRGDMPGKVIIQTMRPDHYALVYARDHQYGKMFTHEMKLRRNPAFPPYLRLSALRLQGRVEKDVQQTAVQVARFCRKTIINGHFQIETLGPAPAPLDKIKDNYRWQILLKGRDTEQLNVLCVALRNAKRELLSSQCTMVIDVDPENMM